MTQTQAIPLILLCMLISFAYVWSLIATRRIEQGSSRLGAHLLGVIAGLGSAFGTFCIGGVLMMPPAGGFDSTAILILSLGALMLFASLKLLPAKTRQPTVKNIPPEKGSADGTRSALAEGQPAVDELSAPSTSIAASSMTTWKGSTALVVIDAPPSPVQTPKGDSAGNPLPEPSGKPGRSLRAAVQAWWQEQKRQHALNQAKAEQKQRAHQQALGCTFGTFFSARFESHLTGWSMVALLILWLYLFSTQNADGSSLGVQIILSLLATGLIAALICASFLLILPFLLFSLMLLPFIFITIWIEAWHRRSSGQPYVVKAPEPPSSAPPPHTGTVRPTYSPYDDDAFMDTEPAFDGYEEEEEYDADGRLIRRRRRAIRRYRPYDEMDDDHLDTDYDSHRNPRWSTRAHPNHRNSSDWVFPLAVGLWVGSWWGDDD